VSKQPVRFVLNTHWHPDHTGGNETLGKAGALIVAHDNVRTRMAVRQFIEHINRDVPPSPPGALPVVTFATAVTFHWNGDTIHVMHMPHAHTDGDAIVHLAKSNVLHLGDTYFAGAYPIIDLRNGGSIDGLIAAAERALALANPQTRIIPGHGPLSNRVELAAWRDMLVSVRDAVRGLVKRGSTLAQVLASAPTARFDARYGQGFVKPEAFVRMVYRSVGGAPAAGTPPAR
jgi:glyoxylase-like metal-dependent hydrolase (beta-lactamase superfamily II)